MEKEKLIKIVDNFKGKKIGVLGDLILDQFIWGNVERVSPEAPVPVVLVEKEDFALGGAGNTANNIAALGGRVFAIGLLGKDKAARKLLYELKIKNIDTAGIIKDPNRPTIQKIRVIASNQHIVRIDKENNSYIKKKAEEKAVKFITSQIKNWDALVISDYAKGFITKTLAQRIVNLAKKYQKPLICDTKPKHFPYFKNVTLLKQNYKEAMEMAGTENLKETGRIIQRQLKCNLLVTQGSEGMTLFEGSKIKHFSAKAKEVFDITGAGDTVTALVSLSLASGANLEEAAIIANHAAGIVVGKQGTAVVSFEELKRDLEDI